VAWYTGLLGLELIHRQRQDNAYTRELVGIPSAILEVAILQLPKGDQDATATLELIEYIEPFAPSTPRAPNQVGFAHMSMLTDDIFAAHDRLASAGVYFRSGPVLIESGTNLGGHVCYFTDPDGNGLELFQPPASASAPS
jgi:catechol 2,3-dioxygenase-like lactoylglutathione lyase family enzyme